MAHTEPLEYKLNWKTVFLCTIYFYFLPLSCLSAQSWTFDMKSPIPPICRRNSPFNITKTRKYGWLKHSATMGATQLRRAFVTNFLGSAKQAKAPHWSAFQRLIQWFDASGGVTGRGRRQKREKPPRFTIFQRPGNMVDQVYVLSGSHFESFLKQF